MTTYFDSREKPFGFVVTEERAPLGSRGALRIRMVVFGILLCGGRERIGSIREGRRACAPFLARILAISKEVQQSLHRRYM